MEYLNEEYGIKVKAMADTSHKGPFRSEVRCAVTGRFLAGTEKSTSLENALERGKKIARRYYH